MDCDNEFVSSVVASFLNGDSAPVKAEPTAEARVFARQLRSLFVAFTDEGFSDSQAMELIGFSMRNAGNG